MTEERRGKHESGDHPGAPHPFRWPLLILIILQQRWRKTIMPSQGMGDDEYNRDLLTRISTALAMTEAAYMEARRRRGT